MLFYQNHLSWPDHQLTLPPINSPAAPMAASFSYYDSAGTMPMGSLVPESRRGSVSGWSMASGSLGTWSYAGSEQPSRSPLSNFSFFKNLGEKKITRDGQPPKRRGPKPDSKPALTRRQELNRQAQRTHRERKELYIKALEQEVLRLKEMFASTTQERDVMAEENKRLKELLAAHGISYDVTSSGPPTFTRTGNSAYDTSATDSTSGSMSYASGQRSNSTGYTSPTNFSGSGLPPTSMAPAAPSNFPGAQQTGLDYDQIGIDFVLTLEKPCMDHMQYLCVRSNASPEGEELSGHVLMATCPPESHIIHHPDDPYPHKMPDVAMPDLLKLLDLSNRLPLDGEITPIMALAAILKHPRMRELTAAEFESVKLDLLGKVRCYGFGAVLEEFEVRDALNHVLAAKS